MWLPDRQTDAIKSDPYVPLCFAGDTKIIVKIKTMFTRKKCVYLPECIKYEERIVKHGLWLVMLEGEEHRIAEPGPAYQPQGDQPVPWGTLVHVQHLTRVKYLKNRPNIHQPQGDQPVPWGTLVHVQHLTRVKYLGKKLIY